MKLYKQLNDGTWLVFQEDDALRNDSTYPGIHGWWKETFDRDFKTDWDRAADTEVDNVDCFTRTISGLKIVNDPEDNLEHTYNVWYSFDGYGVSRFVQ